ncbi:MAG TPA: acyl-CoA dehydrogenase family protein [Aeromicrobium sp.]|nr:acyl-CoA dehydrogenase family protein [Aeromicrobium sp.]
MRTSEQNDLAAAVRSLLTKQADSAAVRAAMASETGYDPALWSTLCAQIGVTGLSVADTAPVLEELGYSLAPTPLLNSLVANEALAGTGESDLIERIEAGEVAALVTESPVLYGAQAAILLALTDEGLVQVDSADVRDQPGLDPTLRFATVDLTNASTRKISADGEAAAARAREALLIGISALAVGTAQRGLDMTVAYSKERVQFGRLIGSFQALKHRMSDMLVLVEMARSASWAAAGGELDPATAASYCLDALQKVAAETIQLHGGIAITWEHDAHLVFKRAHALTQLAGQPHQLRADVL